MFYVQNPFSLNRFVIWRYDVNLLIYTIGDNKVHLASEMRVG